MNYSSLKVRDAMLKISQNEIYLPAIQRKFVWGTDRIENLFDSIMCGYPIGTFLFWFVNGDTKNEYTFYKFVQNYHERDNAWNEVAPKPDLRDQFIGVLDGQQRLNSMYVALQGSYAYKRKHGRWNDDAAFLERCLYLNLFYQPNDNDENGTAYEFAFLTRAEVAVVDNDHYWFLVKQVLMWSDIAPVFKLINDATAKHSDHKALLVERGASLLNMLWQRLCSDDVINYFSIFDQQLDKIVDIFVRVNSAGLQLSKTDLLFSSIVAHWDEGRSSIEALILALNAKGSGFAFDNDFVMRSCLVLTDLPVLFKVNSFKKENIERIKQNWPQIKAALETTVDLLVRWGFSTQTLSTLNAVIPIVYFIFHGGDIAQSAAALRQYLIRTFLNQVFASKTDRVLGAIRDYLRISNDDGKTYKLKNLRFTFSDILSMNLPEGRTLLIDDDDIEELLSQKKGPYTFLVLSLLYPQLKFEQVQFHQDHLHPASQFTSSNLTKLGLTANEIEKWHEDRDKLPNLQLMEGAENEAKNAKPFATWLDETWHDKADIGRIHFLDSNFIPSQISLEFSAFPVFFEARKGLLRQKLRASLKRSDVLP